MLPEERADLAVAKATGATGATTVAATMIAAHLAGIRVFATGGIGGVHRGHPFDISADLSELGRTPVTVVAGESVEPKPGNAMPLLNVPLGTSIHNIELLPGGGGKVARAAGQHLAGFGEDLLYLDLFQAGQVHINDLHATVLHLMGLDHERLTFEHHGRPFRLTDVAGKVVKEIIA